MRPQNVGIHGIEIYFPKTYISQQELEQFDKVSEGKYTIGLGQQNMAFVEPYEDVNSLALTVVQNTLEKYNISPTQIGRLEVGTETLLDKSKSTKTILMQLFSSYGNHDIEGVTTINACYGGTAALFNTLAWVESSAYDGKKYGLVVCVDIAVYKKGPARPTGGAGAICILIGPNAPIQVEEIRSTFIDHVYDFYKPDAFSEFPTVDGHLSIKTYLNAIDNNYKKMNEKLKERLNKKFSLNDFQYVCFHAPFAKMVQKAFSRLYFNDVLSQNNPQINITEEERNTLLKKEYDSNEVQKLINKLALNDWNKKVKPSLFFGEQLGNIYTGSLYAGLCSLLGNENIQIQKGERVLMFSYGSGLASSFFVLNFKADYSKMQNKLDMKQRLAQRIKVPIEEFDRIMQERQQQYGLLQQNIKVNLDKIEVGAFYLSDIDKNWRRKYLRKIENKVKINQISNNSQEDYDNQRQKVSERLSELKKQIVKNSY